MSGSGDGLTCNKEETNSGDDVFRLLDGPMQGSGVVGVGDIYVDVWHRSHRHEKLLGAVDGGEMKGGLSLSVFCTGVGTAVQEEYGEVVQTVDQNGSANRYLFARFPAKRRRAWMAHLLFAQAKCRGVLPISVSQSTPYCLISTSALFRRPPQSELSPAKQRLWRRVKPPRECIRLRGDRKGDERAMASPTPAHAGCNN